MGETGVGEAKGSGGILWMIIWLIILCSVSFWVAGIVAWWYIAVIPFTVCIPQLAIVSDWLLRAVQLPYFCTWNMMQQNSFGEAIASAATCVPPVAIIAQNPESHSEDKTQQQEDNPKEDTAMNV